MILPEAFTTRREMLFSLVARELKSRYKGSALGFLWSILTPLFMAAIYVFFLRLLARGVPVEEIVIGVFAWQFTVQSVQAGMESITGNANLVKKVFFPRHILPLSTTLAALVNFLITLAVQFVLVGALLAWKGGALSAAAWAVPLVIVLHTLFNLGLALLMGSANVYFRDTQHLVGVLLSAWFFISPVMYPLAWVEHFAATSPLVWKLYLLNPLAVIVTAYRALILPGVAFPCSAIAIVGAVWPLLLLIVAGRVFKRAQRNFADML
jgi:lipopolysaccharide transport system permease protein